MAKADALRRAIREEAAGVPTYVPPITVDNAPVVLGMFEELPWVVVRRLRDGGPEVRAWATPLAIQMLRSSLEERHTVHEAQASVRADWRLRRSACLEYVSHVGPEASAAIPDLLALLDRVALEGEFAGFKSLFEELLASVFRDDPAPLLEVVESEHESKRIIAIRALRHMPRRHAGKIGPALAALIDGGSREQTRRVLQALSNLKWFSEDAAESLRARDDDPGQWRNWIEGLQKYIPRDDIANQK